MRWLAAALLVIPSLVVLNLQPGSEQRNTVELTEPEELAKGEVEGGVGAPVGTPVSGALLLSDGLTSLAESLPAGGAASVRL